MKKLIYLFAFISLCYSNHTLSQIVIQEGFENVTCGNVPPNYSPFFDGCVNDWISTHGSPGINQGNIAPFEGNNYTYMYVNFKGFSCTSSPHRGEGVAVNYAFQAGATYQITYAIRGQNTPPPFATFERNWVLTNGLPNNTGGSNGCDPGEVIPNTPANSQFLPTPSYNNNSWTVNQQTFTANSDFSQLWFRARNHHSTATAEVFSQMYLDAFVLEIIDLPCEPDPVTITANGVDITNTLEHTIPCDDNCVTLQATNLENAEYNTNNPGVLTDLQGLFCVINDQLTSFTATITGLDSCGDPYSQNVTINLEQDCCPFITEVSLWDNSYENPSGPSDGNYTDYTDAECIPIFDLNPPQINITPSEGGQQIALFVDLNGDGDFCDPGEEVTNGLDTGSPGTGVNIQTLIGAGLITGGETVRIVVSDGPITCDAIPECGEAEDYVLCDPCPDEPYIEPFWEQCASNNVCELEDWPVHVLDGNGDPLLIIDGYSFLWSDGSTSDVLYGVMAWEQYWVEVTYPDGCVYTLEYYKECCEGEISVIFDECPEAPMAVLLENDIRNHDPQRSVVTLEEKESALRAYQDLGRSFGKDCDPCVGGVVVITIVDENDNELTDFETISITDNNTNTTVQVDLTQFTVYVDTPYTVTVTTVDDEGNECEYTYDFIYECCGELTAPINVQLNGNVLSWDPVPGADGYIVENSPIWPIDCRCDSPMSLVPIETMETSVTLPLNGNNCFVLQVRARCTDGTWSQPSDLICVGGGGGHGDGKGLTASITPNPTHGEMMFHVTTHNDSDVEIEVYNFYGVKVRTLEMRASADTVTSVSWDGAHLNKGVYFVKFKTDTETLTQRVIVH